MGKEDAEGIEDAEDTGEHDAVQYEDNVAWFF